MRRHLAPMGLLFIAVRLFANLSLCSLCSSLGSLLDTDPPVQTTPTAPESVIGDTREARSTMKPSPISLDSTYADPDGFFTLRHPSAWHRKTSGSETQFWADETGKAAVAISRKVKVTSAEDVLNQASLVLSQRAGKYQETSRHEGTLNGERAVWVAHTYQWQSVSRHGFMVGVVRNRVGHLLLAYAPPSQFAGLQPTFDALIDSLQLITFEDTPAYGEWSTYQSPHFACHYLPGTFVAHEIEGIALAHEGAFDANVAALELNYQAPIHLFFYPSRQTLYHATARRYGFAIAEAHEVHTYWASWDDRQSLGHEITHVITHWSIGDPHEALLGEGVAVCLDRATPHPHERAAALSRAGRLVPLSEMLGDSWFGHDPDVAYPESGSVACYLLERYGVVPFKTIYTRVDLVNALPEVYGLNLNQLEREWLAVLDAF